MAEEFKQDIAFEGQQSNMVPATMISRIVDTADIGFGLPVKQGSDDKACAAGIAAGDFVGITVAEAGISEFAKDTEARIMTQGVIWVKAAATVTAGDTVSYKAGTGWGKAVTTGNVILDEARYETGGGANDLVQVRLWGTSTTAGSGS